MMCPLLRPERRRQADWRADQHQRFQLLNKAKAEWKDQVLEWYPRLWEQTYFLPPVFMVRIQRSQQMVGNQEVLVNEPPVKQARTSAYLETDLREDQAHLKVLSCLEHLSQKEVMFVISRMEFTDYLSVNRYNSAASMLPRPVDAGLPYPADGDIDILAIHRQHGIIAAELKAVGDNAAERNESQEQRDANLLKRIKQATKQLHRYRWLLKHMVSKDTSKPKILTTLMLPYISTAHLQRVLGNNPELREDLCASLDVNKSVDPSKLCLTETDLDDPDAWWARLTKASCSDTVMSDSLYLDLVSRFAGPATNVKVPPVKVFSANKHIQHGAVNVRLQTRGDGVAEAARRVAPKEIVLNRRQVEILQTNRQERMVYLLGPPGTGKTLVLIVKGLDWLGEEKAVHVFSSAPEAKAAAHMIYNTLKESGGRRAEERIKFHHFDLKGRETGKIATAAEALKKEANKGELFIIADEICQKFRELSNLLSKEVPGLHIWAASIYTACQPPQFKKAALNEALRTTPRITREIKGSASMSHQADVPMYASTASAPAPCEGPKPISILHNANSGHSANTTYDCRECGHQVASALHELHVGRLRSSLKYGEVFVLTAGRTLREETTDASGNVVPACGFLQGLTAGGFPVRVLKEGDPEDITQEVATMAGPDRVIVAECRMVSGLESPVVIWVQGDQSSTDEDIGRLHAMSRCTAQLIWVRRDTSYGIDSVSRLTI